MDGRLTPGVVRIGATVRRPLHARSEYVHAVLQHLEQVGFEGAPRLLGTDKQGHELLTYIEGEVPDGSPVRMSETRLRSAARLIRRFHDATTGTSLAAGGEVVCHGDLGHHNMVFVGEQAVALIDWDEGVAPGPRLVDFAHAVWCFAGVGEKAMPIDDQIRGVSLMCDAYDWDDRPALIEEIADRLRRARDDHARHGRAGAVAAFEEMVASMEVVRPALHAGLEK